MLAVSPYRILFLRGHLLEHWEPLEAADDLAAIEKVMQSRSTAVIELWRDDVRLATYRPAANSNVQEELQPVAVAPR